MTNKLYHKQNFELAINGIDYKLTCFTQDTRTGFRHLCFHTSICQDGTPNIKNCIARCVYYNRTWEEYCYQSVLREAVTKILYELTYSMINKAMDTVQEVH